MLADLGRWEDALGAFAEAIRCQPNDPMPHYNLADTADRAGDMPLAAQHWRQFLQLEPAKPNYSDFARARLAAIA